MSNASQMLKSKEFHYIFTGFKHHSGVTMSKSPENGNWTKWNSHKNSVHLQYWKTELKDNEESIEDTTMFTGTAEKMEQLSKLID